MGEIIAFGWGLAAGAGLLVGAGMSLTRRMSHRTIAAAMSLGAGVLLAIASTRIAAEALPVAGAASTVAGIVLGAALFSIVNAALAGAKDRKRCGDCKPQPSESGVPGSGLSIAAGTALDAIPEALVLGITLRAGGPDPVLIVALALSNVPEALSATAGMRMASRSVRYIVGLWLAVVLGGAALTALAYHLLGDLSGTMTATLKALGAGALIAVAAETMIPEAFHNGPRYSGVLAASGFAVLIVLGAIAR